jgi:RNA-binding protein
MAFISRIEWRGMQLTEKQRRHLKGLAHPLRPVILMGQAGLTDAVVAETTRALADHELIKVRLPGLDRTQRDAALQGLAERTGSSMVTRIGHVAVLYRRGEPLPRIVLPD